MADVSPLKKVPPRRQVVAPAVAAYAEAVRAALADGGPIVDYGTCCAGLGNAAAEGAVRIAPPTGVIEHHVSDFTLTVAGGATLAEIQQALDEHNQFLPIDGVPPSASIAEIIAHNLYGPLRLGYGAMRELLLGLRIIDGHGRLLHVGGRTLKNVAGYDVTRLMIGNLNTFGLIAEATLRTAARPTHATAVHIAAGTPWDLAPRTTALLTSDAMPTHLATHATLAADGAASHRVHLGYFGSQVGRDAQFAALEHWLTRNLPDAGASRADLPFEDDEAERETQRAWQDHVPAWVKIIVPPAEAGPLVRRIIEHLAAERIPADITTLPAWGVIHVGGELDADAARALDRRLLAACESTAGLRAWMRRPHDADDIPPFAPEQPDWSLLRRLRNVFNPHDAINPGRFI